MRNVVATAGVISALILTPGLLACSAGSGGGDRPDEVTGTEALALDTTGAAPVTDPTVPTGSTGQGALVETRPATSLGLDAFSPNGRIQPHGRPTSYHFEFGATPDYGSATPEADLPPRLAAYYKESWDGTLGGWRGGMSGTELALEPKGGKKGGFVRASFPGQWDCNHQDGIGTNELLQYLGTGAYEGSPYNALGGGDADLRGARISTYVRGNHFKPKGSEVVFWIQSTSNVATQYDYEASRWANWAFTGQNLTDALLTNRWQRVEYRLVNDTSLWTFAGYNVEYNRAAYVKGYWSIDQVLAHANGDIFHMLVNYDYFNEPEGSVDFDELQIAYRNRSVLLASNGGRLVSAPAKGSDPARLTDGWRNGAHKSWRSPHAPVAPVEIVYALANPVAIDTVQIHQSPEWPSRDVEVLVSQDGVTYETIAAGALADQSPEGVNSNFFLQRGLQATASFVKVRILSGYSDRYWGLGEIEVFGTGAVMETDDDWYDVNTDVTGLTPGATYHYRLVATGADGTVAGDDRTFTVPATTIPEVTTGPASRIHRSTAKVEGRLNALGESTNYYFDFGLTTDYGAHTERAIYGGLAYGGVGITPRMVSAPLTGLVRGTTYHYRLVAVNVTGTSFGADATFTTTP